MKNLRGGGKGAIIYYVPWGWGFPENFGLSKLYSPPAPHATKKSHMKIVPLSSEIKILKMHPAQPF